MRLGILVVLTIVLTAVACGDGEGGPSASAGPNLIENPGGEQSADGYIGHNGATISQDTTTASEGAASIRVAIPDAQGAGVQIWKPDGSTMTAVTPGVAYEFSADVKGDVGKTIRLEILWHRTDDSFLSTSLGPVFFLPLGSFEKLSFVDIAPEEAALAVPQIVTDAAPGGSLTMWVDNVRFEQGSAATGPASTGTPGPQ